MHGHLHTSWICDLASVRNVAGNISIVRQSSSVIAAVAEVEVAPSVGSDGQDFRLHVVARATVL